MITFDQFKEIVNELYSMGKVEVFTDKDKHSHECLTLYLYCDSIDNNKISIVEKLKPEYWNIIPYGDQLQIYISIVHVNKNIDDINSWLEENLYLKVTNFQEKN